MAMQKQRDSPKRVLMADSCFNSNAVSKSHLLLRKIAFHLPAPFCAGSGRTQLINSISKTYCRSKLDIFKFKILKNFRFTFAF